MPVQDKTTATTLKLTTRELELLTALVADQLFRREFIDPKMPGHRADPAEITLGKALVARFRAALNPAFGKRTPPATMAG